MVEQISPNFTSAELRGWDQASESQRRNARWVIRHLLQPARDRFGPMRITGWVFDHPSHGQASTSVHPSGGAIDFVPLQEEIPVVHRWMGHELQGLYGELIDERDHIHATRFNMGGQGELLVEPVEGRYAAVDPAVGFPGGAGTYGRPISLPGITARVDGGPWRKVAPWLLVAALLLTVGGLDPFKGRGLTRHT